MARVIISGDVSLIGIIMRSLDALKRYCLTGTTEGDKSFIKKAFINHDQLSNLLSIEPGGMRILVGNKGTGKTAILEWISAVTASKKLPSLLLRPDNLKTDMLGASSDIGSLKNHFYSALIHGIATQIGANLKGFLVGDKAILFNEAKKAGKTSPDYVEKTLELLTAISVPVTKVDGVKLAKELAGDGNPNALIAAINNHLLSTGNIFILLIDDTDQVAIPTQSDQLNRIWALLLAVRKLGGECKTLRCIVSLRSEIWTRLISEELGQRDQTDHLRDLVVSLRVSDDLMKKILLRRLTLAAKDADNFKGDPYNLFFDGDRVTLPTSTETRPWDTFILKSARERPRDVIQLVRKMIDRAEKNHSQKIDNRAAADGMKDFSKERVQDLATEFSQDCQTIKKIIDGFAQLKFEVGYDEILTHLKSVGSEFSLIIRGETIKPNDQNHALYLLKFLHETGFINPKVLDNRQDRGFRHISFEDNPDFVESANTNEMKQATWEIHPAFRSYLLGKKEDTIAKFGNILHRG